MKGEKDYRRTIDDLVHKTYSLFTFSVISCPLLPKVSSSLVKDVPRNERLLGSHRDLQDDDVPRWILDEIMCLAFLTTWKGSTQVLVWFKNLRSRLVNKFAQLSKLFVNHFIKGQRFRRQQILSP